MAFQQKLETFKNSMLNNLPLLRNSLYQELLDEVERPDLPEALKRTARELLFLSAFREGQLAEARALSEYAQGEIGKIFMSLWSFQKFPFGATEVEDLRNSVRSLPALADSVLLALLDCLTLDPQGRLIESHERQMSLLVMGLPAEARGSWRKIQNNLIKNQICRLEMRVDERTLMYAGQRLDFSSKRSLFQILKVLGPSGRLTIEEAIQALWQTEMEESYFARLRTAIQRLNDILASVLPLQKPIELNSKELKLSPTIELHVLTRNQ